MGINETEKSPNWEYLVKDHHQYNYGKVRLKESMILFCEEVIVSVRSLLDVNEETNQQANDCAQLVSIEQS